MQSQKLESLGVLVGGVAHDFNNLLAGVLGNAGVAARGLPDDDPVRANLTQIQTAATRAAELTRNMLAYAGKGKFVIEPFDLSVLVKEIAQLLEAMVSRKAELHLQLATGLPAVEADAGRNLGYVRAIGRRRTDAPLYEPVTSVPMDYAKKPLLREE